MECLFSVRKRKEAHGFGDESGAPTTGLYLCVGESKE